MKNLTQLDIEQIESLTTTLRTKVLEFGPKLLLAIIVLIVGRRLINIAAKYATRGLEKSNIDISLKKFLSSTIKIGLKILLLISVASMIGIETTSFVAVIGAAGLAIGLALQGSLENFSGGVLILLFKPYKIGDYIEAQGEAGTVDSISVFNTTLITPGGVTKIIPNGKLANNNITNYTKQKIRRIEIVVGVGYEADSKKTKKVLTELVSKHPKVLKEPAPQIALLELAESSVNWTIRPHVLNKDYREVYFELMEQIKETLDKNKINIPYPHQVIEIKKES